MFKHKKDEEVKVKRERDGTKVDLWLAKITGCLTVQITNYTTKSQTLVRLDAFYLVAEAIVGLGFSEEILPYAYAVSPENPTLKTPYQTNVLAIIDHIRWPITVADHMTEAAQKMVGHFTGHPVEVGQMGGMRSTDEGDIDLTIVMSDQEWTEPFELADDCIFCEKMTDQNVLDRVAGFQWALDKEVAGRFGAGLANGVTTPKHYDHVDTDEGRREYHNELKPWYADHPQLFKVITLIDLPMHLKRTLCIQWNHIVLQHLKDEPRFSYVPEDDLYYWLNIDAEYDETTNRIIPSIKTRSNPAGGRTNAQDIYNPFYGYGGWYVHGG